MYSPFVDRKLFELFALLSVAFAAIDSRYHNMITIGKKRLYDRKEATLRHILMPRNNSN